MNALDRAIAFVAPEWGARRAAARYGLEKLATYPDAVPTRLDSPITAPGVSPDWSLELGRDRRQLVDRVRDLERTNVLACALLDRSVESVVGTGFTYQARTKDPEWNRAAEALWQAFVEDADERGLSTLHEMIALLFRGYLRDGEGALVKLTTGKVRSLESDEIGMPEGYYRPGQVDGVELDKHGRPKTFHVFKPDMKVLYSDRRISGVRLAIPAGDVIFVARRTRANQTRGLTAFNGCFWALEQIKGSIEAVTVSLRMSACLGLVLKKASPINAPAARDPNSPSGQRRTLNLAPGAVLQLLPGEEVTTVTPAGVGPFFEAHVRLLMRIAATAFGMPLEVALGDFGPLNLSAARANLQQACRAWKILQKVVERVYDALKDWKLLEWMEAKKLANRKDWRARHWVRPGFMILDSVAETEGDLAALDGNFETLSEILGRRGSSLEAFIAQKTHDNKALKAAGIETTHSTLTRDKVAPAAPQGGRPPRKPREGARGRPQDLAGVRRRVRRELELAGATRNAG